MLLSKELFAEEKRPASFTLEDHIGLEQSTGGVNEAMREIRTASLQLEGLRDAEEHLEAFSKLYDVAQEDGTLGLQLEQAYRLTLENYFGPEFAQEAEFSQEGIADVIKRIGRATANAGGRIQRGWKDFIATVSGGWDKLNNRISAVENTLDGLDRNAKPNKDQVKMGGGSRLHIKGSMESKTLVAAYPEAMGTLTQFAKSTTTFGRQLIDHIDSVQKEIVKLDKKTDKSDIERLQKEARSATEEWIDQYHKEVKGLDKIVLPGGQGLVVPKLPSFTVDRDTKDEKISDLSVLNTNRFGKYREKDTIEIPEVDHMKDLLTSARSNITAMLKLVEDSAGLIDDASEMYKSKDNLPKIKKKITVSYGDKTGDIVVEAIMVTLENYFGNNVARWMDYVIDNLLDIYIYLFSTTRALVEYCEQGAKAYTK
jgi:hypothetical protein